MWADTRRLLPRLEKDQNRGARLAMRYGVLPGLMLAQLRGSWINPELKTLLHGHPIGEIEAAWNVKLRPPCCGCQATNAISGILPCINGTCRVNNSRRLRPSDRLQRESEKLTPVQPNNPTVATVFRLGPRYNARCWCSPVDGCGLGGKGGGNLEHSLDREVKYRSLAELAVSVSAMSHSKPHQFLIPASPRSNRSRAVSGSLYPSGWSGRAALQRLLRNSIFPNT